MVNWSEHTKRTLPFNCSNTTPDKAEARKARRRVLIIGKARRRVLWVRHVGARAHKARNLAESLEMNIDLQIFQDDY